MKTFEYNGRNYKIVNGLAHRVDESGDFTTCDPCYRGDNILLDDYCDILGVRMYERPSGIHAYGNQEGSRSK